MQSAVRWSCQELLASHPSPIHLELPDQAIRGSLCRVSEASRILTLANFRHPIVSGASICSRLSSAYLPWNEKVIAQRIRYIIASSSFTRFPCKIWEILMHTLWRSVIVCIENYQRVIDWQLGSYRLCSRIRCLQMAILISRFFVLSLS